MAEYLARYFSEKKMADGMKLSLGTEENTLVCCWE